MNHHQLPSSHLLVCDEKLVLFFCIGDRILAVNGQSLERVTHEHAVNILKNVTSPVELRVSQSTYNLSSFGELFQATGLLVINFFECSKSELLSLYSLKGSPQFYSNLFRL